MGKKRGNNNNNSNKRGGSDTSESVQAAKVRRNSAKFTMSPDAIVNDCYGDNGRLRDFLTEETVLNDGIVRYRVGNKDRDFDLTNNTGNFKVGGVNLRDHKKQKLEEDEKEAAQKKKQQAKSGKARK